MSTIPTSNITFTELNSALNFPFAGNNNITLGPNNIIRRLTGNTSLLNDTTPISTADLAGKVVFANLAANTASANTSNFGNRTNPVFAEAIVSFNTDMRDVVANWSTTVLTDTFGNITPGDVTITPITATSARLRLRNDSNVPVIKAGDIRATVNLVAPNALIGDGTVTDFTVRQENITVPMRAQMLDSGLVVSGETNPTAIDFQPVVATTTLVATSTIASNASFTFTATRVSGSDATITISPTTINLELRRQDIGTVTAVYDVDVTLFSNGVRIINQVQRVTLTATRQLAAMQLTANTASARSYANNASFNVFALLNAAVPDLSGTSVVWSISEASGNSATLTVGSSNTSASSANLSFGFVSGTFGLKRENYVVRAEQRYGNGQVITSNSVSVTLEGGNIGHSYSAPPSVAASGYQAQTAITSGSATVLAPQAALSWRSQLISGTSATVSQTASTITLQLPATARGSSFSNEYTITSVVSFDGQEIASRSSSLIMNASFNNYTFSVTAPSSNTSVVDSGATNATIVTSASFNIPGGSIQWSTNRAGGFTSTTSNTATSTLSVVNAQSATQNYTVTATLLDDLGRFVESTTLSQQLRAGSIALVFNGSSSVSNTGVGTRTFNASYSASVGSGSSVTITATRVSGDTFTVSGSNPITISGSTSIGSLSRSGTYSVVAQPSIFGINGTPQTINANFSLVQTGSGATIAVANGTNSAYTATVSSNGTATVTLPPGFVVAWSGTVTGGTATPAGNVLTVTATRTTIGSSTATATYTASILTDTGVATGESFNVTVTATASRLNPNLQLGVTGSLVNEGFTPISSFADVVATFDSGGAVTFDTSVISGPTPSTSALSNGVKVELNANRNIASTVVRVTATLRLSGSVIATASRDVELYAGSYFLDLADSGGSTSVSVFEPNTASASQSFTASTNYPYAFTYSWSNTGSGTRSSVGPSTTMTLARNSIGTSSASGNVTVSIPAAGVSASLPYSLSATVQASVSVSLSPSSSTINVNSDTTSPSATSSFTPNISGGTPPYTVSWSGSGSGITFGSGSASSAAARFTRATRSGTITVNVTDSGGRTASASAAVSHVYDYTTVPISIGTDGGSFNADTTNAAASLTTTLNPTVTGGNGTRSNVWTVLSNPGGLGFSSGTVTSSASRYSNSSRTISVRLTVTDQAGQVASRDFSVTHSYSSTAPAFSASLDSSAASAQSYGPGLQSATAVIRAVVNSGVPPYSYSWTLGPAPGAFTSSSGDTASLTATTTGEAFYSIAASVLVSDSLGRSTTLNGSLSVDVWNTDNARQ
jgi:hypothetical protein